MEKIDKFAIGLTGMPACGKSTATKILQRYNIPSFKMSDVILDEIVKRDIETTPENYENLAVELRKNYGNEVIAKRILNKIEASNEYKVCIDGIRNLSELELLRNKHKGFLLVAVHSPPKIRYERTKNNPKSPIKTWEQFEWRDKKNLELGVGDVISLADYMITNNRNSFDDLEKGIKELISYINENCGQK